MGMSDVLTAGEPLWKWNLRACARFLSVCPMCRARRRGDGRASSRACGGPGRGAWAARSAGRAAWVKDRPVIELVDLPCFGRPTRLVWRKHRFTCPDPDCETRSWTGEHRDVAPPRAAMTDRAGRWATAQVGRNGRSVSEVARELGCDWHTINDAVIAYGTPLVDDPDRIGAVSALGLDETLFCRRGRWRRQEWCTSIVDVTRPSQLLDMVEDRSAAGPIRVDRRASPSRGGPRSAGVSWICRARIARPSPTRSPHAGRSPIRSIW